MLREISQPGRVMVAGGTDVMVKGRTKPIYAKKTLVDISRVPELAKMGLAGGFLEIGAGVRLCDLASATLVRKGAPLLADAAAHVGGRQTRNLATIGGNLANACPAADCIPALMVLGAEILAVSESGSRTIKISSLFKDCKPCLSHDGMHVRTCLFSDPTRQKLDLASGEAIASIRVPIEPNDELHLFRKLTSHAGVGLAVMNLATVARVESGGTVSLVRASMGGLFSRPIVLDECTTPLVGIAPSVGACRRAGEALGDLIDLRLANYEYKRAVAMDYLADGLCELFGLAGDYDGGEWSY